MAAEDVLFSWTFHDLPDFILAFLFFLAALFFTAVFPTLAGLSLLSKKFSENLEKHPLKILPGLFLIILALFTFVFWGILILADFSRFPTEPGEPFHGQEALFLSFLFSLLISTTGILTVPGLYLLSEEWMPLIKKHWKPIWLVISLAILVSCVTGSYVLSMPG